MENTLSSRVTILNPQTSVRSQGKFVIYWMIASRRTTWNFALERAFFWCHQLQRPLIVFEPLRAGYQWASDRFHRFIIEGMYDNAAHLKKARIAYYPYIEPEPGAGSGLLESLAKDACVVVTDEYPAFFLPRMVKSAGEKLSCALEQVDSNGILPLRAPGQSFSTAYSFRRALQRLLPSEITSRPIARPLDARVLPKVAQGCTVPPKILERWPSAPLDSIVKKQDLSWLPIDHSVEPVAIRGGSAAAQSRWKTFLEKRFERYRDDARHPDLSATSELSPSLHFGHISSHQLVHELLEREEWTPQFLPEKVTGSRGQTWGASPSAETFLDQLVTWRELGFNFCLYHPDTYMSFETLPKWAQKTLDEHSVDTRPILYTTDQLETAKTHDELWNAAQRELIREGKIHNSLRMLWGKLILQWSPTPVEALRRMFRLNDRYALDGRDPNSASGILWTLGLFDRAWGPERPIFGKVRYMTSQSARRKLKLRSYLERFGPKETKR